MQVMLNLIYIKSAYAMGLWGHLLGILPGIHICIGWHSDFRRGLCSMWYVIAFYWRVVQCFYNATTRNVLDLEWRLK